jgi:fructose-1,6-bisphosphatase/inositol monophosphatase family enzyme
MTAADLSTLAAILRDAARAEILPRFRHLDAAAVRHKTGPLDLVTDADEAAERMIAARLARYFPGCVIVGEEAASADPSLLERLADAELAFVIDPVDGTSNFAAGLALFGVMAAAIRRGEVVASAIHDPIGDDTALALRGEGAWIEAADGWRATCPGALCRSHNEPSSVATCRAWGEAGTIGVRRMSTAWRRPAIATSWCSTGCCPGTTPPAGCCIARPAAFRPGSIAVRTVRR